MTPPPTFILVEELIQHSVHPPPFPLSAWGGWTSYQIYKKGEAQQDLSF